MMKIESEFYHIFYAKSIANRNKISHIQGNTIVFQDVLVLSKGTLPI